MSLQDAALDRETLLHRRGHHRHVQGDDEVLVEQWREAVQAAELAERLTKQAADSGHRGGGPPPEAAVMLAWQTGEALERAATTARRVANSRAQEGRT